MQDFFETTSTVHPIRTPGCFPRGTTTTHPQKFHLTPPAPKRFHEWTRPCKIGSIKPQIQKGSSGRFQHLWPKEFQQNPWPWHVHVKYWLVDDKIPVSNGYSQRIPIINWIGSIIPYIPGFWSLLKWVPGYQTKTSCEHFIPCRTCYHATSNSTWCLRMGTCWPSQP